VNAASHSIVTPSRKTLLIASFIVVAILATMATAKAGVTGTEFQATYDLIVGWAKGYLGKIFAVAAFLIGAGFSAARQNPMPAIFGLVLALIIGFGPSLIESILTATV
jgi:conjugal transfer pilus assembly protein TraA